MVFSVTGKVSLPVTLAIKLNFLDLVFLVFIPDSEKKCLDFVRKWNEPCVARNGIGDKIIISSSQGNHTESTLDRKLCRSNKFTWGSRETFSDGSRPVLSHFPSQVHAHGWNFKSVLHPSLYPRCFLRLNFELSCKLTPESVNAFHKLLKFVQQQLAFFMSFKV